MEALIQHNKKTMGVASVIIGGLFLFSIMSNIFKELIRRRSRYVDRSASHIPFRLVIRQRRVVVLAMVFPKQSMFIVQFGIEDTCIDSQGKVEEFKQRKSAEPETSFNEDFHCSPEYR